MPSTDLRKAYELFGLSEGAIAKLLREDKEAIALNSCENSASPTALALILTSALAKRLAKTAS